MHLKCAQLFAKSLVADQTPTFDLIMGYNGNQE